MAEELEMDLIEEPNINKAEERIKNLSSKVKEKALENETERKLREEAEARAASLEKERDFFASFSDQVSKFPAASEFKDAIKEKVLAGYTAEDATVAVLNANGRLMPQENNVEVGPIAGGSAPTQLTGDRPSSNLSQEERRQKLMDMDSRGELADLLKNL